eukprot:22672_1
MMALAEELDGKQRIIKDRISILKSDEIFDDSSDEISVKQFNLGFSTPTILFDHHSALLTITQTCLAVFMKCFPAFIAFVISEYDFSYQFVTRALAIGSLSTMICIVVLPQLLNFRANIAFFFICIIGCVGTFILWYFKHNKIFFTIGVALVFNTFQLQWGSSNAIISSFVDKNDKDRAHKYLSSLSAGWTYATFLFIGVGFILKYETFNDYLAWMFVIISVLAILNLLMLPKVSINKYNQMYYGSLSPAHISIIHDLKILFSLKKYRLIILLLALTFTAWSYIYTSFGYWIKKLYNLDEAQLGIAAALIEGFGNLAAILLITYGASNNNRSDNNKYKLKLQNMMIYFALFLILSVGAIFIINYVSIFTHLLNFKCVVYGLICIYFFGSEGVIVGGMILSVTETPQSQQARSSAIISITNSVCLFVGQFTIGYVYAKGGFKSETPILLAIQIMLVFGTVYLSYVMRKYQMNPELIHINNKKYKNSYSIYT